MIEKAVPQTFENYIGQEKAKETLQTVLKNTKRQINDLIQIPSLKQAAMFMPPSILIVGPPGYGKTRLAQIYASEMNQLAQKHEWPLWAQEVNGTKNYGKQTWDGIGLPNEPYFFASIEGKDIKDSNVLDHYFYYLQIQGVLFIDECQTIPSKLHEHFLRIMSEQKYHSDIANCLMEHFGFTLIGATTHEYKMFRPFLERFKLTITMESYKPEEISGIILHYCKELGYSINKEALEVLVDRSRDNPRTITQNLDMLFMMKENGTITKEDALKATGLRGIGIHGLTDKDQQILRILGEHGKASAETLSEIIEAVDVRNYKSQYERFLINKELILPTNGGRILTGKGKKVLEELKN